MNLTANTKLLIDVSLVLIINYLFFISLNLISWFELDQRIFFKISILYIIFCTLTFVIGRILHTLRRDGKSVFIFVLGTMVLKTVISIGLIVVLFGLGELTQRGEIIPILAIYLIYTYLIIRILKYIDK